MPVKCMTAHGRGRASLADLDIDPTTDCDEFAANHEHPKRIGHRRPFGYCSVGVTYEGRYRKNPTYDTYVIFEFLDRVPGPRGGGEGRLDDWVHRNWKRSQVDLLDRKSPTAEIAFDWAEKAMAECMQRSDPDTGDFGDQVLTAGDVARIQKGRRTARRMRRDSKGRFIGKRRRRRRR